MLDRADSVLLVIDVQERLSPAMHGMAEAERSIGLLIEAARLLEVPVVATEQYPKGLGATVPAIAALLPADAMMPKLDFSAAADAGVMQRLSGVGRRTAIVCGIEAHVCVLLTAFGLHGAGWRVAVAIDACASRRVGSHAVARDRMAAAGIEIVTAEMVCFEWLRRAGTDEFRAVSRLLK